jgi:chaperonin GroEL (HSP60 family)
MVLMRRVGKYPGWKDTRTLGKHTGGERLLARALTELLHPIARNAGFDESLVSAKGRAGQGDFGSKAETLLYQNLIPRHHRSGQRRGEAMLCAIAAPVHRLMA